MLTKKLINLCRCFHSLATKLYEKKKKKKKIPLRRVTAVAVSSLLTWTDFFNPLVIFAKIRPSFTRTGFAFVKL